MTGMTHAALIARMQVSGEMERRRELLRAWFSGHPGGTPYQALAAFPDWTLADHMAVVADSIWIDLRRNGRAGQAASAL
jgi:hypothetical protein